MKKALSLLLALALLPGTALALTSTKGANDVAYPVTGGNIYFDPATGTVTAADISVTEAAIPGEINGVPVTAIGKFAFLTCENMTGVTIPGSVATLGTGAFMGCKALTGVTIPDGVTAIGASLFFGCTELTSVKLPDSVTSIGASAFAVCQKLTDINIPNGVTTIGQSAFDNCFSLKDLTIPSSVTSIGEKAFFYCRSLTSVTIPFGVTAIGPETFGWCRALTEVTIPKSVTSIGDEAFDDCYRLKDVYYGGCVHDWAEVSVGEDTHSYGSSGNKSLLNATMHYGYCPHDGTGETVVTTAGGGLEILFDFMKYEDTAFGFQYRYVLMNNSDEDIEGYYAVIIGDECEHEFKYEGQHDLSNLGDDLPFPLDASILYYNGEIFPIDVSLKAGESKYGGWYESSYLWDPSTDLKMVLVKFDSLEERESLLHDDPRLYQESIWGLDYKDQWKIWDADFMRELFGLTIPTVRLDYIYIGADLGFQYKIKPEN